jgi:diguanylate cyclase (GGDEF)-like protein
MFTRIQENIARIIAPHIIERRDELERIANTDELTGLANRRAFDLAESAARREGLAFILFDCNFFGQINKQYSHKEGDKALRYFSDVIANVARKTNARAFRYGSGDEFVIIADWQRAIEIRDAVEHRAIPLHYVGFTVSITGEVGESIEAADSTLQKRKAERKAQ